VSDNKTAGVLINIKFTVSAHAKAGDAHVRITVETRDAIDDTGKPVSVSITNGSVRITRDGEPAESGSHEPETGKQDNQDDKDTEIIEIPPDVVPDNSKEVTGERPGFIIAGDESGKDEKTASVPYTKKENETPQNLVAYHVSPSGETTPVPVSSYNEETEAMEFNGIPGELYVIAPGKIVSFADVLVTDWFYGAVSFVTARRLFEGVGGGSFAPRNTMTRAMFVTVLARLDGVKLTDYKTPPYTDTAIDTWYGPAVAWAADLKIINAGILSGCEPGTFKPGDNITREQMAVIFANYIKIKKLSLKETKTAEFSDIGQASQWARSAIGSMRNLAVINGVGDNLYNPKGVASRAEVAQIFTNLINAVLK
jgi:hypothetical protein